MIKTEIIGRLVQRIKDGEKRWALVSRKTGRVLKWFGKEKPSPETVKKEEARVQMFKHIKSAKDNIYKTMYEGYVIGQKQHGFDILSFEDWKNEMLKSENNIISKYENYDENVKVEVLEDLYAEDMDGNSEIIKKGSRLIIIEVFPDFYVFEYNGKEYGADIDEVNAKTELVIKGASEWEEKENERKKQEEIKIINEKANKSYKLEKCRDDLLYLQNKELSGVEIGKIEKSNYFKVKNYNDSQRELISEICKNYNLDFDNDIIKASKNIEAQLNFDIDGFNKKFTEIIKEFDQKVEDVRSNVFDMDNDVGRLIMLQYDKIKKEIVKINEKKNDIIDYTKQMLQNFEIYNRYKKL